MDNFNQIKKIDAQNSQVVVESGVKLFELYNYLVGKKFHNSIYPRLL